MFQVVARDLSKEYRIYRRPVDRLLEALTRRPRHRVMSALEGVSFALRQGQSLGVIGDNGAGKSTLLKLLVGTLAPSRGQVQASGRVAALLELGAGFHPEFSGRQNIKLSGSIMGIEAAEMATREEEIIEFSGLREFIDRPVKTYSSGMYIRLGFAIATSVDADILVIDEALAVGDLSFQRKCVERMNRFREEGKTMIFCSHSMYHVQELCDTTIWLHGRIVRRGSTGEVISEYKDHCDRRMQENAAGSAKAKVPSSSSAPNEECRIESLTLETPDGIPVDCLAPLTDVMMKMEVEILREGASPHFGFALLNTEEVIIAATSTYHDGLKLGPYKAGQRVSISLLAEALPLREGTFRLAATVGDNTGLLWYGWQHLEPMKVKAETGFGQVTFKHEWNVRNSPFPVNRK